MYNIRSIADIHGGKNHDKRLFEKELPLFLDDVKNKPTDAVIICGDTFDRILKLSEPASKYIISVMNELNDWSIKTKKPVRVIKGTKTHDGNQLNNFKVLESQNINFRIINEFCEEYLFPDLKVLYIPEEYVENPEEYYKVIEEAPENNWDCCFGHGTFDFAGNTHGTREDIERPIKNAPTFKGSLFNRVCRVTLFGHFHEKCQSGNIRYIGSFSSNNFAEISDKGYVNLKIDKDSFEIEDIINTNAPKYITVNVDDLEGVNPEEKIKLIKDLHEKYDHVKLITKNKNKDDLTLIKKITSNNENIKIEVKNKIESKKVNDEYRFIIERKLPLNEMISKFIKIKNDVDIDTDFIDEIIK